MMSNTFGAPFGGTTRGAHQAFESVAFSVITPPKAGGGGGSCLPSIVVVALGSPSVPVTCWESAAVVPNTSNKKQKMKARISSRSFVPIILSMTRLLLGLVLKTVPVDETYNHNIDRHPVSKVLLRPWLHVMK
jgi:hypothetical protein